MRSHFAFYFFFFNDTATTEIYTLSLHDALPIFISRPPVKDGGGRHTTPQLVEDRRSEEHTSELQSRSDLVCRLLLENKNLAWLQGLDRAPAFHFFRVLQNQILILFLLPLLHGLR